MIFWPTVCPPVSLSVTHELRIHHLSGFQTILDIYAITDDYENSWFTYLTGVILRKRLSHTDV